MTRRDPQLRLRHMLDYARTARRLADGRQQADLETDEGLQLALVRAVEVIGEAAASVPEAVRQNHPDIPWRQIISTRNRLIHGYDEVDNRVLWDIVEIDLPPLIEQLATMLREPDVRD